MSSHVERNLQTVREDFKFKVTDHGTNSIALVLRTVALLILLYQLRLLASDLADTPFFGASLAGALAAAFFLNRKKVKGNHVRPIEAFIIIALVPWAIRFFIALPRSFFPGVSDAAILLDSLLLNLDRNYFPALLPFYWLAITTYFSMRSRIFLRADIIAADTFFLVLFSIVSASSIEAYRWPILMIGLFALVLFLQVLALVFSMPPELRLRGKEKILAGAFLLLLIISGGTFFIRPFQERAISQGGGLLEPKLFRFDFSQFLRLESEISVSDDLVLIIKKDPYDSHNLLRRYTLSGYSPRQGFFRLDDVDEAAHPQSLPNRRILLPTREIESFQLTEQEYYVVNFDASAFIGMNMPVEVIPFESWDASSFNSAYAVVSHTSEALPYELIQSVRGRPGPQSLGLDPEEYALYTEYGGDEAIASFAREIVESQASRLGRRSDGSTASYWEQVQMVYDRLKFGEFRYSLKPGIASDGDQLKHFLFTSKKGYCSYYAFAFTLMLRSLGIPSRVAAGFFVDPSTEAFNYFPVRTDMAHAWAEVWFPGYGWIEYDPTSQTMAEGEEFRFSQGTPPELFERLMKEILDNRSRLRVKEGEEGENGRRDWAALGRTTINFFARNGLFLIAPILVFLFLITHSGFLWLSLIRKNPAKKALCLWAHTKRRLSLAGIGKLSAEAEAEWANTADRRVNGIYTLYLDAAAARFAPVFTIEDFMNMTEHYRIFSEEYRKAISLKRRLLAWLLPPLALILRIQPPSAGKNKNSSGGAKTIGAILIIAFVFLFSTETGAQDDPFLPSEQRADALYESAMAAQRAENWERAVELYSRGSEEYPWDLRFPWSLGNLYYYRRLYNLAWDEYRRAEKIISWETSNLMEVVGLFYQLANTAGYLNKNEVSAAYYELVLAIEPDNREAVGSLAWMYFKLHRLEEGENLLLDSIERMGEDMDFDMTLGTIYSDMFRYQESKDSYLKAIRGAEIIGDRLFAALSHYNLSILESRFYQFGLAFDRTNTSLEAMDRASGRLARGELYVTRMELSRALADYQEAYSTDSSPLSKLNLAQLFQIGGRLSDAVLYAKDCLKVGDESWMLNYGIDPVRYKRDIHEILKDSYEGLFKAERFFLADNKAGGFPKEQIKSLFRKISYRFRFAVHSHLFRKYTLLAADAYKGSKGEVHPEALIQYYNAFEVYPRRALNYLRQVRDFEAPLIPGSIPSYDLEEARLLKNSKLLKQALGEFDPLWERNKIAIVYEELALKGKKTERQDASERLFAINRGALLRNGIRLPVELRIGAEAAHIEGILKKIVKDAGLEIARLDSPRYTLSFISGSEREISCELYDNGRGIIVWKQEMPFASFNRGSVTRAQRTALAQVLRDGIFDPF